MFANSQYGKEKTPITRTIIQVLKGKKKSNKDKQPAKSPLENAQVNVSRGASADGGIYDVSINGIAQNVAPSIEEPARRLEPMVNPAVLPSPASRPVPKPEPGTTILRVGDTVLPQPQPQTVKIIQPQLQPQLQPEIILPTPINEPITTLAENYGPSIYTVPAAPSANHGYSIQPTSIPQPTPVPLLHQAPPSSAIFQPAPMPSFMPQSPQPQFPQQQQFVQPGQIYQTPASAYQPPVATYQPPISTYQPPQPSMVQFSPIMNTQSVYPANVAYPTAAPNGSMPYSLPAANIPNSVAYGGDKAYAVTLPNITFQTNGGFQ